MTLKPAALIVFGSTARDEARPDSDVDVLAVRPRGVSGDDDVWTDGLIDWCHSAGMVLRRPVEMMEAGEDEIPDLLARPGDSVWHDIVEQGVVVIGRPLGDLAVRV